MKPATRPITLEIVIAGADPLEIRSGPSIVPIERLKLFSSSDWKGFVNEWDSSLDSYGLVERTGGSGDMGCDVIGMVDPKTPDSAWDNYQCKHYDHALAPPDIWIELTKLCYYTFIGAYSIPRRYVFAAPRGVGTKLTRRAGRERCAGTHGTAQHGLGAGQRPGMARRPASPGAAVLSAAADRGAGAAARSSSCRLHLAASAVSHPSCRRARAYPGRMVAPRRRGTGRARLLAGGG